MDETYIGSEKKGEIGWKKRKSVVVIAAEENGQGIGRIRMATVPQATRKSTIGGDAGLNSRRHLLARWGLANPPLCYENVGNTEETTMPTRKHIEPGTKIGLKLTAAERKLILDDLMCLDDSYAEVIKATPADQPVEFTLDDWDGLGGFIAAEANHTQDRKAGKKLDAIFNKVQKILDTYTDEEPLKTLKIEDARKAKHPQGNVAGVAKLKKDKTEKPKASTTAATVFQFKITLKEIEPLSGGESR